MSISKPSQEQLSKLIKYFQDRQFVDAEKLAVSITKEFPEHQFTWKVLGVILIQVGRLNESLTATQKSIELNPTDSEAHYNLGVILKGLDRSNEAEKSYRQAITLKPNYAEAHNNLGNILQELGRLDEAEKSFRQAIVLKPDFTEAHNNLAITLQELHKLNEAEKSFRQVIALRPDYAEAHSNLGITLKELGQLKEAEKSYRKAISLKPDFTEVHNNLGLTLQNLRRLDEAEKSYRKAIALKPDFTEAHSNLGITLKELGRLDEAESSYRKAISLKPDFAEAHNNLGNILQELGRLDEAEKIFRQAIALKPDFAEAHNNLGKNLYKLGNKDLALESIEKANNIDPQFQDARLLLKVIKSKKSREESENTTGDTNNKCTKTGLTSNPLILNRVVEKELIANLYEMSSRELDKTIDARYGNGKCSPDFNLFHDSRSIIQNVAKDLTKIMMEAVKSEVYIIGSFFNILSAGGGSNPHNHLNDLDKDIGFDLGKQKYSLVYYLSVGDQHCNEPGILKLYEPSEDILPCEGMITIIPASRMHSAVYGGKTDRVMIGANFYSL
jgi:Flp pilus assembly protein TadD